jgi:hypothetical protein
MGIASRRCGPREGSEEKWPPMKDWLGGPAHRRPLIVHSFIHPYTFGKCGDASCLVHYFSAPIRLLSQAGRSVPQRQRSSRVWCVSRAAQELPIMRRPCIRALPGPYIHVIQQRHRGQAQQDFRCTGARGRGHLPVSVTSPPS